jgi:transcription elongation factor Elf1
MFDHDLNANPFNIRMMQRCPMCRAEQVSANVEILEEVGSGFLAYLSCTRCGASLIVRVAAMPQGLVGNAILTDLSSDEVVRFATTDNVSADDVLQAWELGTSEKLLAAIGLPVQVYESKPVA